MRYKTKLSQSILTNEKAQEIIDFVSPIYGDSYVALWLFQAIGTVLEEICDISDQLREETNPITASLLLSYWESYYALPENPSLSDEQRRLRLLSKVQQRPPCTPTKLASMISNALGGVEVEVTERTGKNQFTVNIREVVPSIVPAVAIIERMKPAHLIYVLQVATQTVAEADIKIAIAMTHAESYKVEVLQ